MPSRRQILGLALSASSTMLCTILGSRVLAKPFPKGGEPDLRGAMDTSDYRAVPGVAGDQRRVLQRMIEQAARENARVFLPPGTYAVSNLTLPDGARLIGVAGASRIVYTGGGYLFAAEGAGRIELSDIVIDGGNRPLGDDAGALLQFTAVDEVLIDNCDIVGSRKYGIQMERCGGRFERNRISQAGQAAIYAIDSTGLSISDNVVTDCDNGGILVHRWTKGEDGTIVSGNRITRIGASDGGTGENGNGINVFRAGNVMVTNNHVSDCAFTAVRANSASNVQISGNQCHRSGETAIYCEFAFEGAVVSANVIDGAANGISIANFNEGGRLATVTGNVVRNLSLDGPYKHESGFGIGIAAEADTLVSNNVVENAPRWGLQLGWGPYMRNLVVNGNIVRKAPVGCAVSVVEGAGAAVITENIFEAMTDGAIIGYRWDERATNELATAGASAFTHLSLEGNRLI